MSRRRGTAPGVLQPDGDIDKHGRSADSLRRKIRSMARQGPQRICGRFWRMRPRTRIERITRTALAGLEHHAIPDCFRGRMKLSSVGLESEVNPALLITSPPRRGACSRGLSGNQSSGEPSDHQDRQLAQTLACRTKRSTAGSRVTGSRIDRGMPTCGRKEYCVGHACCADQDLLGSTFPWPTLRSSPASSEAVAWRPGSPKSFSAPVPLQEQPCIRPRSFARRRR
jgi:hypothetical protein